MKYLPILLILFSVNLLIAQTAHKSHVATFQSYTSLNSTTAKLDLEEPARIHGSIPNFCIFGTQPEEIKIKISGLRADGSVVNAHFIYPNQPDAISLIHNELGIKPGLKADISFFINESVRELRFSSNHVQALEQLQLHLSRQSLVIDNKTLVKNPRIKCPQNFLIAIDASSSMSENESVSIYNGLMNVSESLNTNFTQVVVFNDHIIYNGSLTEYLQDAVDLQAVKNTANITRTNWNSITEEVLKRHTDCLIIITDNIPNMHMQNETTSSVALDQSINDFNTIKESGTHVTFIAGDQITNKNAQYALGLVTTFEHARQPMSFQSDYQLHDIDYIVLDRFEDIKAIFTPEHLPNCNKKIKAPISLAPNPASKFIQLNGLDDITGWNAALYDNSGKCIKTISNATGTIIHTGDLIEGSYQLRCTDAKNNVLFTEKVIIVH